MAIHDCYLFATSRAAAVSPMRKHTELGQHVQRDMLCTTAIATHNPSADQSFVISALLAILRLLNFCCF